MQGNRRERGAAWLTAVRAVVAMLAFALSGIARSEPEGIFLGEGTNLFLVTLTNNQAQLKQVKGLPFQPEPLGASTNAGGEVFMMTTNSLVSFNLLTSNYVETAVTLPLYAGISQGDLGPDGMFYFTDSVSNDLWAIDWAASPPIPATRVGRLVTAAGLPVQLVGGDCGFAADGTLCLWSNWPREFDAPRGLYKFQIPPAASWPTDVTATFEPPHAVLTGLAIAKMEPGQMAAATWPDNTIVSIACSNAQVAATYPLYLGGNPYTNEGGDMAVGIYSNESPSESLFLGDGTNLFLVTLTNSPLNQADLTPLADFPFDVGVIGTTTARPGQVFFLSSTGLVTFDLISTNYSVDAVTFPQGISFSQADMDTNGLFYFTDSVSNNLWAIDPSQGAPLAPERVGLLTTPAGLPIGLHGADIGFASNGTLYVWSNWEQGPDAPMGLYSFIVPPSADWPTNIAAATEPAHLLVTGLAVSKTGLPTVVMSTWADSTIVQMDPANGQVLSTTPIYLDAQPYAHYGGDLAIAISTNGTPFSWLTAFGLGGGGWNRDALADQDADGLASWQEYIAGTNPTNLSSTLSLSCSVTPLSAAGSTAGFVVTWPSTPGRFYDLDRATNLLLGGFQPIAVQIPATPPENVYTDAVDGIDMATYRVRVYLPK